jgi:hypothetical protein
MEKFIVVKERNNNQGSMIPIMASAQLLALIGEHFIQLSNFVERPLYTAYPNSYILSSSAILPNEPWPFECQLQIMTFPLYYDIDACFVLKDNSHANPLHLCRIEVGLSSLWSNEKDYKDISHSNLGEIDKWNTFTIYDRGNENSQSSVSSLHGSIMCNNNKMIGNIMNSIINSNLFTYGMNALSSYSNCDELIAKACILHSPMLLLCKILLLSIDEIICNHTYGYVLKVFNTSIWTNNYITLDMQIYKKENSTNLSHGEFLTISLNHNRNSEVEISSNIVCLACNKSNTIKSITLVDFDVMKQDVLNFVIEVCGIFIK